MKSAGAAVGLALGVLAVTVALSLQSSGLAHADEGGASFWTPGSYGSFAAQAPSAGWSLPITYYGFSGSMKGTAATPDGRSVTGSQSGPLNEMTLAPTYTPTTTIFGGIPSFSIEFGPAANSETEKVGGDSRSDSAYGALDVVPLAQLFWTQAVNNEMVYVTGNIPVGSYDPNRVSNLGIGHAAVDVGGAYTYYDDKTGHEASATLGFTFNTVNPSTNYRNGVDLHLDLGASQAVNAQVYVGAVGYVYQQLTPDHGQPAAFGANESRGLGVGPQIGSNFTWNGVAYSANLRGYWEFDAYRRADGPSVFATLTVPLPGPFGPAAPPAHP